MDLLLGKQLYPSCVLEQGDSCGASHILSPTTTKQAPGPGDSRLELGWLYCKQELSFHRGCQEGGLLSP